MSGSSNPITPPVDQPAWRSLPSLSGLVSAAMIAGAALVLGLWLRDELHLANLSILFLLSVLISAVRFGFWTGLFAAAITFLAYNFFFVEPIHSFSVARAEDVVTLGVFLSVAALTGLLAGRMRVEADNALRRAEMLEFLSDFSSDLSGAASIDDIERLIMRHLARATHGPAVLLRQDGERLIRVDSSPEKLELNDTEWNAADWVLRHNAARLATAPGWSDGRFHFHPLLANGALLRVIGVASTQDNRVHAHEREHAVEAILRQGSVAIERFAFARQASEARATAERATLRSALLSSLSHDLRTPLATILGSVTSLRHLGDALPPEARADLLLAIEEETDRLSRFVSNLLNMTRLQSGLDMRLDWIDVIDVANGAINRARRAFQGRRIELSAPSSLPLLHSDATLLDQVLFNLIDNAVKFSPADSVIRIAVSADAGIATLSVQDDGRGIPTRDLERVFEAFYRSPDAVEPGTGLGLAICRGIVQALGGTIEAQSPMTPTGGTLMRVQMPIKTPEAL